VICYNQALVTLEDDVTVSQYSYLCTAGHELSCRNSNQGGLIDTNPLAFAVSPYAEIQQTPT